MHHRSRCCNPDNIQMCMIFFDKITIIVYIHCQLSLEKIKLLFHGHAWSDVGIETGVLGRQASAVGGAVSLHHR